MEQQKSAAEPEKAVIAGLAADTMDPGSRSTEESLDELEALLETAGGVCLARALQKRGAPEPRTFIGEGKVKELKELVETHECTLAVFDNELSPSQVRALSETLGIRVIDRSSLILDIFAGRARTREGRLQVELAQYKYLLPRLSGMWKHLTGQTGTSAPIGTRGPGETQLESDRRHIRRKIAKLEEELEEVMRTRDTQRKLREKNNIPVIALVGYTNAGKSTLLNALTGAGVSAGNRLFDTLDTTTRRVRVDETLEALISDTVGFIRKLPHHLVDAFKATLEELKYADVLVHVIDASSPEWEEQVRVVDDLIQQLGAGNTPRIEAFNKCDIYMGETPPRNERSLEISAGTGAGLDALLAKIAEILNVARRKVTLMLPHSKAGLLQSLYSEGAVLQVEYSQDSILVEASLDAESYGRLKEYIAPAAIRLEPV